MSFRAVSARFSLLDIRTDILGEILFVFTLQAEFGNIHVLFTMRPLAENGEWGAKQKKVYDLDENGEKIPVIDKKTGE